MQNKVLQSVIEITKNRDLDSLEYSLVATLKELVPARQIEVFKTFHQTDKTGVAQVLSLSTDSISDEEQFNWSDEYHIVESDPMLEQCIQSVETCAGKPEDGLCRLIVPVSSERGVAGAVSLYGEEEILSSVELAMGIIKIYENYQIILGESEQDTLTGLFNRRTFDKKLGRLLKAQSEKKNAGLKSGDEEKRGDGPIDSSTWLVVLDFDRFKQINDTYGHIYGDEVLLILSQKMKTCFRQTDILFRFGGDEFVIILEPVGLDDARMVLERFREAVASHDFPQIGSITISTGFARINEQDFPPAILERADKALYYAKEHGRNCIWNYEDLVESGEIQEPKKGSSIDLF
ncbi:MAG: GGDEF domain-containing protein [Halieaceae bacterium]|jgi:diguanylate cyclase (GGDEF)-like protein|nr:GGDEF domain-containing protein [Halieaceae bacterium]